MRIVIVSNVLQVLVPIVVGVVAWEYLDQRWKGHQEDARQDAGARTTLTCPVCLDPILHPIATRCGHIFCRDCLDRWWTEGRMVSTRCPVCNKRLQRRDIFVLYPYIE
ncbi:hypothetical protein H257_08759 [Aphanomyces astaci]|uniref:RING-type domain-containing protein n=1 Tax=Aphanomyces astaci TaxID=112090 RepID=W4GC97_APHAT|nr:hypothetical protein H257_08759 [Aphanomyces astaci]ETV77312.1 hypothetical protein H257_08759 [Aphanomyces astaci]|eukprot:XP_009833099.1 hypothetical protein H257_08759 [Aphanomyces astaci]